MRLQMVVSAHRYGLTLLKQLLSAHQMTCLEMKSPPWHPDPFFSLPWWEERDEKMICLMFLRWSFLPTFVNWSRWSSCQHLMQRAWRGTSPLGSLTLFWFLSPSNIYTLKSWVQVLKTETNQLGKSVYWLHRINLHT
jgi:hypothetical protein